MVRSPSTPTSLPSGPDRFRRFRDADGIEWTAWEVDAAHIAESLQRSAYLDPALAEGWIAFDNLHGDRRRLAPIPEGWELSSDEQLRGLLTRARPVHSPRITIEPHDDGPPDPA
jgi:hypothetical protein